jgi:hypothetical protein
MQTLQKIELSDKTKTAILNFFCGDILANDDRELAKEHYFDNWRKAVKALNDEPKTLGKSTFMFWCYQNIKISTKNIDGAWPLRPNGFEYLDGRPCVCIGRGNFDYGYIALSDAVIHIRDRSPLYERLGI